MPQVTILTSQELSGLLQLDAKAIDCIEQVFSKLSGGTVVMPPILSMHMAESNGEVDVKTAYIPGMDSFAIKVSPGFFDNPSLGLPSTSGLMMQFSSTTGILQTLLLDNGYLTDLRTAAAGGVATRHLARSDAQRVCVFGSGTQAALQLKAICLERHITYASLVARNKQKADALAEKLRAELQIAVDVATDPQFAVRQADIIVTTTPAASPLVLADWLQPGQHITAMGSDQTNKNELEASCIVKADCYVPDRQSQTSKLGELRSAIAAGCVSEDTAFAELGDIISGKAQGRSSDQQITICDLTGTGAQDTAIAAYAYQLACEASIGTAFEF